MHADRIILRSVHDIVTAVPYLIGFHPQSSLVTVILDQSRVVVTTRIDIPAIQDPAGAGYLADHQHDLARRGDTAVVIGYGSPDTVDSIVEEHATGLAWLGMSIVSVLRVDGSRYFQHGGPPAGTAVDFRAGVYPAEATVRGIAPFADRAALEQLLEPAHNDSDDSCGHTAAALTRLRHLGGPAYQRREQAPPAAVVDNGRTTLRDARAAAARRETLSGRDLAWLAVILTVPRIQVDALCACDGDATDRELWIDVTRRAHPLLTAAPACLLAVTAYLRGDGPLAAIALRHAQHAEPGHPIAAALDVAFGAGLHPDRLRDLLHHQSAQ